MNPKVAELNEKLLKERQGLKSFIDEHTVDGVLKVDADERVRFQNWTKSISDLDTELGSVVADSQAIEANEDGLKRLTTPVHGMVFGRGGPAPDQRQPYKSIGQLFTESEAFTGYRKGMKDGPSVEIDLEKQYGRGALRFGLKALFDSADWAPEAIRLPQVISPGEQAPTVAGLMPQGQTRANAVPYMEETTTTPAAAEVAEGDVKPEATIILTEKSSPVRKIAVSLPITDEAMEDVPMVESYLDGRLRAFVQQREDQQLLVGNGVAPNIEGIFDVAGVLTQGQGADSELDAIFKAMTQVQVESFLQATGLVIHPTDWETVRLSKDGVNGGYLLGPAIGASDPRPWGLQTVVTTAIPAGTALVGAFNLGAQVFRRSELSMRIGYVDDQFVRNTKTIVVEERLALVVFRPKAFCLLDFSS